MGTLACWTHALGGLVAVVAACTLPRGRAIRTLVTIALAATPLLPGVLHVLDEGGATAQPPFKATLVLIDLATRFGPGALVLAPIAALGVRAAPSAAAGLALPALALTALVAAGIAAPHQFPYLLVLIVPGALLVARGARSASTRRLVFGVCFLHGAWAGVQSARDVHTLVTDPRDRAIDHALAEPGAGWTCAPHEEPTPTCRGEALILLSGGGGNDDDKRRISPVLWRLRPWSPMPRLTAVPIDWEDHRGGHPRRVDGRAVYIFEHVRPELQTVLDAHSGAHVVVYGRGPRQRFLTELEEITGASATSVGPDHQIRLPTAP